MVGELKEKFGQAEVTEVDPENHQGYHIYLHDMQKNPLARIGVEMHDHRTETFH